MQSAYSLFDELNKSSEYTLSSKTLDSLKDFYFGYQRGLQDGCVEMKDGDPPFSQFSGWLARRYDKSKPSLLGRWTRYDGGWWRIIEEQAGRGEAGFNTFFALLSEFRQQSKVVICRSSLPIHVQTVDSETRIAEFEVLQFTPEPGYHLNIIYVDGRVKEEGFYSNLDHLFNSAKKQFDVILK